jgi:hypothetical protein
LQKTLIWSNGQTFSVFNCGDQAADAKDAGEGQKKDPIEQALGYQAMIDRYRLIETIRYPALQGL